jgi:hypothetical protein
MEHENNYPYVYIWVFLWIFIIYSLIFYIIYFYFFLQYIYDSLLLAEGDFFDAPIPGNALAIAGRSAAQPGAEGTGFGHGINMLTAFQALQKQWPTILSALVAPSELSGSLVDTLWTGASVTVVLDLRAKFVLFFLLGLFF